MVRRFSVGPILFFSVERHVQRSERADLAAVEGEDKRRIAKNLVASEERVKVKMFERAAERAPLPDQRAIFEPNARGAVGRLLEDTDVFFQLERRPGAFAAFRSESFGASAAG